LFPIKFPVFSIAIDPIKASYKKQIHDQKTTPIAYKAFLACKITSGPIPSPASAAILSS
jgi:hypothetical protein